MALYRALGPGWIGRYIFSGEVFDYDGPPGKWMKPVVDAVPPAPAVIAPPEPTTFSEMTKAAAARDADSFRRYSGERPVKKQK